MPACDNKLTYSSPWGCFFGERSETGSSVNAVQWSSVLLWLSTLMSNE